MRGRGAWPTSDISKSRASVHIFPLPALPSSPRAGHVLRPPRLLATVRVSAVRGALSSAAARLLWGPRLLSGSPSPSYPALLPSCYFPSLCLPREPASPARAGRSVSSYLPPARLQASLAPGPSCCLSDNRGVHGAASNTTLQVLHFSLSACLGPGSRPRTAAGHVGVAAWALGPEAHLRSRAPSSFSRKAPPRPRLLVLCWLRSP